MASAVSIPQHVAPGHLQATIDLNKEDLQIAINKLKRAFRELSLRRPGHPAYSSSAAATHAGVAWAPSPSHLSQPRPPQTGSTPATIPAHTLPHAQAARPNLPHSSVPSQATAAPPVDVVTAAVHHLALGVPAHSGIDSAVPLPPPFPVPAPPLATHSAPHHQPTPAAAAPPPPSLPPAQPPPSSFRKAAPQEPAAPSGGMSWQLCWSTDCQDHQRDPVSALAYLPAVQGLPGGEGHAGWVVSASRALLNLWECSPSGGRGEPALCIMHSQETDFAYAALDADPDMRLLLGASIDRSGGEGVALHSLSVDAGMLAPKGRLPVPHPGAAPLPGQNLLAVVSLHSFGSALAGCCAAAYGGGIAVWQPGTLPRLARPQQPRAVWKAHASKITALHKSNHRLSLFSGAEDGTVHMWSMREKPSTPATTWRLGGRVVGLSHVSEELLVTGSADGRVMVWDLRSPSHPLKFAVPDGQSLQRMSVSPFSDCVAVSTPGGLYGVDLLDDACHVSTIMPNAPRAPLSALCWNAVTSEVLVGGGSGGCGSISVYRQRPAW